MELKINKNSCILCNKCVQICTVKIFSCEEKSSVIKTQNENFCIACGHCVAICPTASIEHPDFPASSIHPIDRTLLPSAEQMATIIKARRSNRAFSTKPLPTEYLQQIVEAAYRCPTASNEQELAFTIVTNPEKIHRVSELTLEVFSSILKWIKPVKPIVKLFAPEVSGLISPFWDMVEKFERGDDLILRNAKAILLIHSNAAARFGRQDANLAYQNASLMAESLGVAHFYTGFVCVATDMDKKQRLAKELGINGKIDAGMALAMPTFKFEKYIDRKAMKVNWVE